VFIDELRATNPEFDAWWQARAKELGIPCEPLSREASIGVLGRKLVGLMDFPDAAEIAERLKEWLTRRDSNSRPPDSGSDALSG
jgi:hypothetical protein